MRKYLPFVIVGLVAIGALIEAGILYRANLPPPLRPVGVSATEAPSDAHILGPANAPVTLEEFGDFQCPPCGILSTPLSKIVEEFRPHVRLIYREFPLPMHAHARAAAVAAEAAGLQGKFWPMHDLLYREQATWSKAGEVRELFNTYARFLNLDLDRFNKDVDGAATTRVESDKQAGTALGVQNTPTILLNNITVEPKNLEPTSLRAAVGAAVKAKSG